MKNISLHKFWWLWIPVAGIALQIIIEMTLPMDVRSALHSEWGPHETLQFIVAAIACFISLRLLLEKEIRQDRFLFFWVSCAFLGTAYITGEEISWGQHIFEWGTPEFWSSVNDQEETNLHNASSWLDQKPRLLLEIGVIVGGLIIPLLKKYKPSALPQKFEKIYPPAILAVTALCAMVPKLIEKTGEAFDIQTFARVSEVQELYLFYFVLLYLICLKRHLKI